MDEQQMTTLAHIRDKAIKKAEEAFDDGECHRAHELLDMARDADHIWRKHKIMIEHPGLAR